MPGIVLPRGFGRVSRRFADGSTTQGMRTKFTTTQYADIDAFSCAFWIYRTAAVTSDRALVVSDDNNSSHGWRIEIINGNLIRLNTIGSSNMRKDSTTAAALDGCTHVVVRNSSMSGMTTATADFVINGVVEAGSASANGGGHGTGTPYHLTIGNYNDGSAAAPVCLAHVAIWLAKLGDLPAQDLNAGACPLDFPYGLAGYWALDGRGKHGLERDLSRRGQSLFPFGTGAPAWGPAIRRELYVPRSRSYKAPAGGGSTFNDTVTESVTAAETATGALVAAVARAETLTAADSATGNVVTAVGTSDTLTAAESATGAMVAVVARAETLSATDSQDATVTAGGTSAQAETLTASDAATATVVYAVTRAEALAASDTDTATAIVNALLAEVVAAVESATGAWTTSASRAESLTAVDSQTATTSLTEPDDWVVAGPFTDVGPRATLTDVSPRATLTAVAPTLVTSPVEFP